MKEENKSKLAITFIFSVITVSVWCSGVYYGQKNEVSVWSSSDSKFTLLEITPRSDRIEYQQLSSVDDMQPDIEINPIRGY